MAHGEKERRQTNIDIDRIETTTPEAFANDFRVPDEVRRQFVRGLCVIALADGVPDARVTHEARRFASAVGIDEPALRPLELFAEGQMLLGKLDYLRRSNLRGMVEGELERGVFAGMKSLLGVRGLLRDPLVAEPFLTLGDLPNETLGRRALASRRTRANLPWFQTVRRSRRAASHGAWGVC